MKTWIFLTKQFQSILVQMINGGEHGEVATQLLTSLPLAYICGSAYYSLFKLVIFSYYRMVPKATEPRSLLLNAGQVCRFAAPLAFNFMHVIRMNEVSLLPVATDKKATKIANSNSCQFYCQNSFCLWWTIANKPNLCSLRQFNWCAFLPPEII